MILALFAPSAGDVEALMDLVHQRGQIGRIVLQVAVHGDDDVAARLIEARRQRRGLPEVAPQPDDFQPPVGLHQVRQQLEAAIARRIVNEENLIRLGHAFEHGGEPVVEPQNRPLFVVDRDNDGKHCSMFMIARNY